MPRVKETLSQIFNQIGINMDKERMEKKEAFLTQLDVQLENLWNGLVGNWLNYKKACLEDIKPNIQKRYIAELRDNIT